MHLDRVRLGNCRRATGLWSGGNGSNARYARNSSYTGGSVEWNRASAGNSGDPSGPCVPRDAVRKLNRYGSIRDRVRRSRTKHAPHIHSIGRAATQHPSTIQRARTSRYGRGSIVDRPVQLTGRAHPLRVCFRPLADVRGNHRNAIIIPMPNRIALTAAAGRCGRSKILSSMLRLPRTYPAKAISMDRAVREGPSGARPLPLRVWSLVLTRDRVFRLLGLTKS